MTHRLPTHVVPEHYSLVLAPDINRGRFTGSVAIDVRINETTRELVCNAAELDIRSAHLDTDGLTHELHHHIDETTERLHLSTPTTVAAGWARLRIHFVGTFNDQLRGFYRSTYTDDNGVKQTIATTQFQSTDARRAFPCWDEPALKATFATTLIVDADHLAISNTAEIASEILEDGRRRVTFAPTMRLSTYLVAFVVGPLEATKPIKVDGIPIRIVHRPGQGHLTDYAMQVAEFALGWFARYYDLPYPGDKVDLVAVPDFAFGAMENLGCVTFRETLLLVDPATAGHSEVQRATDVINHELAHMWFGDLVTMQWWEGIWLNEAFATFMEITCSDAFRPQWRAWETFARARSAAFDVDALNATRPIEYRVESPAQAEGMFDLLTYEKGAAVVKMLERYLGANVFREGVRHYLRTHRYANTHTTDLWDALEDVSGRPVRTMMQCWIYQGGHPVVTTTPGSHGLKVSQQHFTLDRSAAQDRLWSVPLHVRTDSESHQLLLTEPTTYLTGVTGAVRSLNDDGFGFFRSIIDGKDPNAIDTAANVAANLHSLIDDEWALTLAGRRSAVEFMALIESIDIGDELNVWQAVATTLNPLVQLTTTHQGAGAALRSKIVTLSRPALYRIGVTSRRGDDDRTRELRATLVRILGAVADDPEIVDFCKALIDKDEEPSLASAALTVFAHHTDSDGFEYLHRRWRNPADPVSEQRHLHAMADIPEIKLIDRLLNFIAAGEVRAQDAPYVLARALTNRHGGRHVWAFIEEHWNDLNRRFPGNSISRMLAGIVTLNTPSDVERIAGFLADNPVPQAARQIAQLLERQRINSAFGDRESLRFAAWLTDCMGP